MRAYQLLNVLNALVAATLILSGCGGRAVEVYPVTVKLAFAEGGTLEGAVVAFQSIPDSNHNNGAKSLGASGKIGPDGTCQLSTYSAGDGAVAGKHRVSISPPMPEREDIGVRRKRKRLIPTRYSSFSTSGLEATVDPDGDNDIAIEIHRT